jgi:hypothetical protein
MLSGRAIYVLSPYEADVVQRAGPDGWETDYFERRLHCTLRRPVLITSFGDGAVRN